MSLSETPTISSARVDKQPTNIYTMMLVVSLLAMIVACACLWNEMSLYQFDMSAASFKPSPPPVINLNPAEAPPANNDVPPAQPTDAVTTPPADPSAPQLP
jgi:hypothetical protein